MIYRLPMMLLVLAVAACGAPPAEPPDVIARVDDRILTASDLHAVDPSGTLTAEEVRTLVDNWIERELMMKLAADRGVLADTVVRWRIDEARSRIALQELAGRLAAEAGGDTLGRVLMDREIARVRSQSRVASMPWRVR